jgi:hypothetical protein
VRYCIFDEEEFENLLMLHSLCPRAVLSAQRSPPIHFKPGWSSTRAMFTTLSYMSPIPHAHCACGLLSAPSRSIPSQPESLPAISSTRPKPSRSGLRFALAAFIASTPAALSFAPDAAQG